MTALQATAPALQELGDLARGHSLQSALQLRLASIAAAPWGADGWEAAASEEIIATCRAHARALLSFAWKGIFEVHSDMLQHANYRYNFCSPRRSP